MIPIVNYDGYLSISNAFENTGKLWAVRKNRHVYLDQLSRCSPTDYGVDLNRNYGFMFAHDNKGSSDDVCSGIYRGPYPFSEPETAAIRDFVKKWSNIKIALNFHASGNLLVTPFNFDNKQNNLLSTNYSEAYKFYMRVQDSGKLP